jgi:hypothetical protein
MKIIMTRDIAEDLISPEEEADETLTDEHILGLLLEDWPELINGAQWELVRGEVHQHDPDGCDAASSCICRQKMEREQRDNGERRAP